MRPMRQNPAEAAQGGQRLWCAAAEDTARIEQRHSRVLSGPDHAAGPSGHRPRRLNLAEELLNAQTNHDAEWNFLKGAICYRRGWLDEARRYYQTAVTMAPDNPEYQRALDILEGRGAAYRPDGYGNVTTGTCGNSDCLRLCGATLCCNALGVPVCFC